MGEERSGAAAGREKPGGKDAASAAAPDGEDAAETAAGPDGSAVAEGGEVRAPTSAAARPLGRRTAYLLAASITIATALVMRFAFGPSAAGRPEMFASIGCLYGLVTIAAIVRMRRRGELGPLLQPKTGDVSLGAFAALLLYGLSLAGRTIVAPRGSPSEGWLVRLYLQITGPGATIGGPSDMERLLTATAVFAIAGLEEVVWRGVVMRSLEPHLGARAALVASSALFALAHLPTVTLLADPVAGPNPLVVAAAFGCGLSWGAIYLRIGRLAPAVLAHAFYSWAVYEFPLWRP